MTTPRPVRHRCELVAGVQLGEGPLLKTQVLELSESGAFIEETPALHQLQVGDGLTLTLALPGGAPWSAAARVTRIGRGRRAVPHRRVAHVTVCVEGFGIEFLPQEETALEQLRDFLELLDER